MSDHTDYLSLVKELSGQQNVLVIHRLYVELAGSIEAALFLGQLLYWSGRSGTEGWFWKSYAEWTEETTIPERSLRRYARRFKDEGWIETRVRKVGGTPKLHWRVVDDQIVKSMRPRWPGGSGHGGRVDPATDAVSSIAEPTDRTYKQTSNDHPDGFDTWWSTYPRKIAKKKAISLYAKALKEGATVEQLLAGARKVAGEVRAGKPRKYVPHPTTWLNQGRWEDEDEPETAEGLPEWIEHARY